MVWEEEVIAVQEKEQFAAGGVDADISRGAWLDCLFLRTTL